MSNINTVKEIYMNFGQGNVPAILEKLSENVTWDINSTVPEVPWLKPRRGRDEVIGFFESLITFNFTKFNPHTFFENGNKVLALIDLEGIFPNNEKTYVLNNEGHLWTFDDSGRVLDYAHICDTHTHLLAHQGK